MIIDNIVNSPHAGMCFWNDWLPPRVNCFIWRSLLKRLPTRLNLRSRGVILPVDTCPLCERVGESIEHLFLFCPCVQEIWKWFSKWCDLSMGQFISLDQLLFAMVDQGKTKRKRKFLEAAIGCILWFVWKARNNVIFNGKRFSVPWVLDETQASLFTWIKYRSNCNSFSWPIWCCNPLSLF